MRRYERWWWRLWAHRPIVNRPPRAHSVELPYIWAAHLWCWVAVGIERAKTRRGDEGNTMQ